MVAIVELLVASADRTLQSSVCTATGALRVRSIDRTADETPPSPHPVLLPPPTPPPPPLAKFDEDDDDEEEDAVAWERCFGIGIFMAARRSRNENGAQRLLLRARTGLSRAAANDDDDEDDERRMANDGPASSAAPRPTELTM